MVVFVGQSPLYHHFTLHLTVQTMPSLMIKKESNHVMESLGSQRSQRKRIQREVLNIPGASTAAQNTSYSYNIKKDSALEKLDPLVEKGRVFWKENRSQLGKWKAKEGDWAFFPKIHGTVSSVTKNGIQHVHFAVGYKEFGQMVNTYGKIVSEWPPLTSATIAPPSPAIIDDKATPPVNYEIYYNYVFLSLIIIIFLYYYYLHLCCSYIAQVTGYQQ